MKIFRGCKYFNMTIEEQWQLAIEAVSLLITKRKVCPYSKKAAILILKALGVDYMEFLEEENCVFDRDDRRVRMWRKKVFERDGRKCVYCGATENLQAHHIVEWAIYPDGRIDVDNGITLCDECHNDEHPELHEGLFIKKVRCGNGKATKSKRAGRKINPTRRSLY